MRILKGKAVYNLIDMKTVFLYVGMLPLGAALKTTGAAQMIADVVAQICGGTGNVYLITAVVFLVSCFMTQFTSNVVTINLLVPIVVAIGETLGVSPAALIVTATIAATCGYVSPVARPCHHHLRQRRLQVQGLRQVQLVPAAADLRAVRCAAAHAVASVIFP